MDHNNQIYSWLLCVERSWSPEATREKKTVRTVAHRGACVVCITYTMDHNNQIYSWLLGVERKSTVRPCTVRPPNGTIASTELSPPMRSALRRVAGARVPSAPFKCNLEMSRKTGNGWTTGIRVSAICAAVRGGGGRWWALRGGGVRCAALRGGGGRCAALRGGGGRWRALRCKKKTS